MSKAFYTQDKQPPTQRRIALYHILTYSRYFITIVVSVSISDIISSYESPCCQWLVPSLHITYTLNQLPMNKRLMEMVIEWTLQWKIIITIIHLALSDDNQNTSDYKLIIEVELSLPTEILLTTYMLSNNNESIIAL